MGNTHWILYTGTTSLNHNKEKLKTHEIYVFNVRLSKIVNFISNR